MRHLSFAPALILALAACGGGGSNDQKDAPTVDTYVPIVDGPPLISCTPVSGTNVKVRLIGQTSAAVLATAPKNDGRLFVVEQGGRIRIFENEQLRTEPFFDLNNVAGTGFVADSPPGERGLLGLAFHPNYAVNREFYIWYTTGTSNVLARYHVSSTDINVAETTGEVILQIPDFASNHNGGMLEFGKDGYLYIGTGDGGGGGDPHRNGQAIDRTQQSCTQSQCEPLLGKILRIDVNTTTGLKKYGIPSDNPFAAGGGEPEIFIIGVRNPWRWSFDKMTGDLYIGDVGQDTDEELDVLTPAQQNGANLGWSMYEATRCFGNYTCSATGKFMPQFQKNQTADGWMSIIGGEVYHGSCFPDLAGSYVFTDYVAHQLTLAKLQGNGTLAITVPTAPTGGWPSGPTSIHADARGELFMTTTSGRIYQIEAGP